MAQNKYLERSHAPYSWRPPALTYLIVAVVTLAVVGISLIGEPIVEIVNGLPSVTDIPGLDVSAVLNATEQNAQPRSVQSIRFVRLLPVPDQAESETTSPSEVYSLGREDQDGSALPTFYCPIFSESDLMRRVFNLRSIRDTGITHYRIYNRYGVYVTYGPR